ncbi:MepB family protein [Patiriisocius marinus]|uniref:MepB family protein n=1 Tax=Patiriisocius marinus TaxID=1397112 RepID=UPI0023300B85|nr:MepB family protein [Patiriisocius marinus]
MNNLLQLIESKIYKPLKIEISNFTFENEGQDYNACNFRINKRTVICRNGKITPKKIGQFVTFWKRNNDKITVPFNENDDFDFYVINVKYSKNKGQFVFPKAALIKHGIISTLKKDGKRGFRIYPSWDNPTSKQALRSQKWQLEYFYILNDTLDFKRIRSLYKI